MFSKAFSFKGRIGRAEYALSQIIYAIIFMLVDPIIKSGKGAMLLLIVLIPLFWFIMAQNTKRCHDYGRNGWWQLIPFYGFWLLFAQGESGANEYGDNPNAVASV